MFKHVMYSVLGTLWVIALIGIAYLIFRPTTPGMLLNKQLYYETHIKWETQEIAALQKQRDALVQKIRTGTGFTMGTGAAQ